MELVSRGGLWTIALLAGCASSSAPASVDSGTEVGSDVAAADSAPACVRWNDTCCQLLYDGGVHCAAVGDGTCYSPCTTSGECTDPARPHCSRQCTCDGTDTFAHSRLVCRAKAEDDCSAAVGP